MPTELVGAWGHRNVTSTHASTLEFTKDETLTPRGDCIFAVKADRSPADFKDEFKDALRHIGSRLKTTIECGNQTDTVTAFGHPDMSLDHSTDSVIRKSDYVCARTIAVEADKSAAQLDRRLVEEIKSGKPVKITLVVCD